MRFTPTSFRPTFGRVLSVVVCAISATGIVGFGVAGDLEGLARYSWGLLLLGATALALYWRPSVDVAEHEVTVRNVFSTWHVPWPAIQNVDTKYALTLITPRGKVTAWASPAPNRYASQTSATRDTRLAGQTVGGAIRPGDLVSTASGAVAFVIRRHLEDLRDEGHLEHAVVDESAFRRDWHIATIVVLALLATATVLGFTL